MSKMGNHIINQAEANSLDNAAEVAELRAEVARLEKSASGRDQVIGNLMAGNHELRNEVGRLDRHLSILIEMARRDGICKGLTPAEVRAVIQIKSDTEDD